MPFQSHSGSAETRITEAQAVLKDLGVPMETLTKRRGERVALALLAIANLTPERQWSEAEAFTGAKSHKLTSREIIKYWRKHYGQDVADSSYDDVRRKDLVWLVEAGIALPSAGKPTATTNNPTRRYAVTPEAGQVLVTYGQKEWPEAAAAFKRQAGELRKKLARHREHNKVGVTLPGGKPLVLKSGHHNEIQKSIVEEFLPRFAPGSEVLYLGDADQKALHLEAAALRDLGFFELTHDALPDVVAFYPAKRWLLLIEAVHSSNPMSSLRHLMLQRLTSRCSVPCVYVSAFKDRKSFGKWLADISWETEVWLADSPDHLVHFNGDKFLGPHS
jgi:hypothetical protein